MILHVTAMDERVGGYMTPAGERAVYIPDFAVTLWRIKFRDMHGIDLDHDVAKIILQTKYEESTWKWKRAIKRIEKVLVDKGLSKDHAIKLANHFVNLALEI